MRSDRNTLRDLHALLYPAAARAIRSHGVRWRYDVTQADDLDWAVILVALHQAGVVVPGPTKGTVSFWYLTWRFGRTDIPDRLNGMLGPSWAEAARYCLWRDAVRGPRVKGSRLNPIRPTDSAEHAGGSRMRYAFRLLDEPTPWRSRTSKGRHKRYRGHVPLRWTSVPWLAPVDLEDRPCLPDHLKNMSTGDSEANSKWIGDTHAAALATSEPRSVVRFLKALEAFKSDASLPFAEAEQCMEAIKEVQAHLEHVLTRLIESLLQRYENSGHIDFLAAAERNLISMPEGICASDLTARVKGVKSKAREQTR